MPGLLAGVFGLAVLDSLNPSAILMTLYLLTGAGHARRVLTYLAGVVGTYFTIGLLALFGLDLATSLGERLLNGPVAYAIQGLIGALMLVYSLLPHRQRGGRRERRPPLTSRPGALFALGATITLVEITTALPYLAAIGLLTSAHLTPVQSLPILVAYNLIFVAPPLLLLAAYGAVGARLEARFTALRARLAAGSREATLWIVGIVGFFLLQDSLAYFEFFGLLASVAPPAGWPAGRAAH